MARRRFGEVGGFERNTGHTEVSQALGGDSFCRNASPPESLHQADVVALLVCDVSEAPVSIRWRRSMANAIGGQEDWHEFRYYGRQLGSV